MYNSVEELLERAKTENKRLHEVIAQNEMSISDISEEMLYDRLEKHYQTMVASAAKAVNAPQDMPGVDFIKGQSLKQAQYSESQTLGGSYLNNIMTMALSCCEVNAGMGRICAAPTAGACGILPAVLIETSRKLNSTKKEILDALLVAAGFGAIFVRNSTVSGAEGGCQAECGVAAAIAAAAAVVFAVSGITYTGAYAYQKYLKPQSNVNFSSHMDDDSTVSVYSSNNMENSKDSTVDVIWGNYVASGS